MAVLPNLQQQNAELQARLAELEAQLAAARKPKAITMKVSEKGALSVYGLGRFPITLYRSQWERLMAEHDHVLSFIQANAHLLSVKAD